MTKDNLVQGLIHIKNECPPIVRHLNERLGKMYADNREFFPDFSKADSVLSISDYAGDNQKGIYDCISFLFVDFNNAGKWDLIRRELRAREKYFVGNMEFKKINQDKVRQRILSEFLKIFDSINGLSLTFLIHRGIRNLIGTFPHRILEKEGLGTWKPHIAEKLLRVIHLQMPLVYGLTNEKNKFLWYTDKDSITKDINLLGEIFGRISKIYQTHEFITFGYAVAFDGSLGKMLEDLLAIPDLVGGAVLEYFNVVKENPKIQLKSDQILKWMADQKTLKKQICIIEPNKNNWCMRFLETRLKQEG